MTAYYRAPVRRVPYRVPRRYRRSTIDPRAIAGAGAAIVAVVAAAGGITGHHGHHNPGRPHHGHTVAVTAPAGGYTPVSFARAVLATDHLPITACNMGAMVAWVNQEGGNWRNQARFNPLNSTQPEPGDSWFQSQGAGSARIRIYVSWRQGLAATVTTLNNGYYPGILAALRAGNSAQAVAAAVDSSPWGTHGVEASC